MKLPIPQDWDGQAWECYQILWPKSDAYTAILTGLITQLMQHRAWNPNTGSAGAAQAIGWDIFKRNYPYQACENCADDGRLTEEQIRASGKYGGIVLLEEEIMPSGVVTEITFVDGKMRVYYGHCCFDEFNIGTAAQQTGGGFDDGVDPANPNNDPAFVYSACSKSHAIVDAVYACVEAAYDAYIQPFPWQIVPTIENAVGYDLDNNHIVELMAFVTSLSLLSISYADLNSPLERQRIICSLVTEVFSDDNVGVPDDATFEQIKAIFLRETGPFSPAVDVTRAAVDCFGRHDLDTVARTSSGEAGKNCDCPDGPANILVDFGVGEDWSHVYDLRSTLPADLVFDGVDDRWTPGIGVWSKPQGTTDKTDTQVRLPITFNTGTAVCKRIAMVWKTVGDEDWDDAATNGLGFENVGRLITKDTIIGVCGENPAAFGTWQMIKTVSVPIAAGEPDFFECDLTAYHPPDEDSPDEHQYSTKLIAIAFAGSGDDPRP